MNRPNSAGTSTPSAGPTTAGGKKPESASGGAFTGLVIGVVIGVALVLVADGLLDDEMRRAPIWNTGRYVLVALFAWMGHLTGSGRGRAVAENIEALAIAVVMALILKHFLVEAYKIPTGSMQPTILGNDEAQIFDRVLVNKLAYLIDDPRRFDVVVFKFPLDRSKNYIKRVAGLGGERLQIRGGNIYFARKGDDGAYGPFQIARKPDHVRDSVMKQVYPSGRKDDSFVDSFEVLRGRARPADAEFDLDAGTRIRYGHGQGVRDRYLDGYDPSWGIAAPNNLGDLGTEYVQDLAIAFDVRPTGAGAVDVSLFGNQLEHVARIPFGEGEATLANGPRGALAEVARGPSHLAIGETARVEFIHVDQELILRIDGRDALRYAYDAAPPAGAAESGIEFGVDGAGARLGAVVVRRDIQYLPSGIAAGNSFDVPDDSIFVLGDNTQNSSDGRHWGAQAVVVQGGRTYIRDHERRGSTPGEFTDIYGETYTIPASPSVSVHELPATEYSFVPRRLLLGKALAVFWPIVPHFRWKLIR